MILDFSQYVFPGALVSPEWALETPPAPQPLNPVDILIGGTLGSHQAVIGTIGDEQLPSNE